MDEKFFTISIVEYDVRNSLTIIEGNQLNSLLNSVCVRGRANWGALVDN
jgi:hypothetical protein